MKKFFLSILMLSIASVTSVNSQELSRGDDIAGTSSKPASINLTDGTKSVLGLLMTRFHSLKVGLIRQDMLSNNESQKSFIAGFSASGALIYNHELTGTDKGLDIVGKNAGLQVLPYTVSIADGNRTFISVAGVSWKNMNSAYNNIPESHSDYYRGKYDVDFEWSESFRVINNLSMLVYEYDHEMSISGVTTKKLKYASIEAKVDILNSSKPGTFLALVGEASAGLSFDKIKTTNGEEIEFDDNYKYYYSNIEKPNHSWGIYTDEGKFSLVNDKAIKLGFEFNTNLKNGWRINGKVLANHSRTGGYAKLESKTVGDVKNVLDVETNAEFEQALNDAKVIRRQFFVTPSLDFSKRISKDDNKASRIGLSIYSNLLTSDKLITTVETIDLSNRQEKAGVKAYLNF
jgi:hypothetical protein